MERSVNWETTQLGANDLTQVLLIREINSNRREESQVHTQLLREAGGAVAPGGAVDRRPAGVHALGVVVIWVVVSLLEAPVGVPLVGPVVPLLVVGGVVGVNDVSAQFGFQLLAAFARLVPVDLLQLVRLQHVQLGLLLHVRGPQVRRCRMKHAVPRISRRIRNKTPPTTPPTMVPRLLSCTEARVGDVNRAPLCWSAAVPVPDVSWRADAVVLGAAVVGGGSAR
ncbi:hypothetical protein EYF80_026779 [Liparis tanakae]|uniref:Uncharacterized protein n=1 Tax=Liparis tanakae TaxID=230148 RepID=A0A4Z2HBS1_9TELE|nr:hypothetical protein EYF80_026779 [Liparis tanakae]